MTTLSRTLDAIRPSGERGFTLVEILVALVVLTLILVAALGVFEFQSRLARVQIDLAEVQQSQRIAQSTLIKQVRMAGRGAVPGRLAIDVRNNVGRDGVAREVAIDAADSPLAAEGSDILLVRGVFTNPLWQINAADAATLQLNRDGDGQVVGGTIRVRNTTPTGVPQAIDVLNRVANDGVPEALLVIGALEDGIHAVVELDPATSTFEVDEGVVTRADIVFRVHGGTHTATYRALSPAGGFPPELESASFLGILEEYRYYVRETPGAPIDLHRLSRARLFPGTEVAYRNAAANLQVDIADDIFDLQVALGIDTTGDGFVTADDWLFSEPGHDPTDGPWSGPGVRDRVSYVRIHTLARTPRPDFGYEAPELTRIEDRDYAGDPFNSTTDRRYRRRHMETVVDMRNL